MSLISPAINKRIGNKYCFFFGAIGHFIFIAATILPAWRGDYPVDKMELED